MTSSGHQCTDKAEEAEIALTDYPSLSNNPEMAKEHKVILLDTGIPEKELIYAIAHHKLWGVLPSDTNLHMLKKAITTVLKGELWIARTLMNKLVHQTSQGKEILKTLTSREKEIIREVSNGLTNKEIAEKLYITEQTVKSHLNRIYRKLNITNRTQLAALNLLI